jgi:hypothetical protein
MTRTRLAALALGILGSFSGCAASPESAPPTALEASPRPRCLRIEYRHSFAPDGSGEAFAIERVLAEGAWAGPRDRVRLAADLGLYRCEIVANADGRVLFAMGFCSIFGEWRTTDDAIATPSLSFLESVRVPEPAVPARFRLSKRDAENRFAPIFEADLPDPVVRPGRPRPDVVTIEEHGPLEECVDLVFLGDGYTEPERGKFLADVRRLANSLLAREPYASLRERFNVRAVFTPSAESGVRHPGRGIERSSALGCSYSTFGLPRYVLTLDDRAWRDAASEAPYDAAILLLNSRDYGGGGILQLYCVAAADSDAAEYLVAHEFGHSFAGLGDEYYSSPVAYREFAKKSVEPWEPNVTALLPGSEPKWRDRIDSQTPLPTPWRKTEFDGLSASTQSLRESLERESLPAPAIAARISESRASILASIFAVPRQVGAYEGALYESEGLYRPEIDCIMFRRDCTYYCVVCDDAIRARIADWCGL